MFYVYVHPFPPEISKHRETRCAMTFILLRFFFFFFEFIQRAIRRNIFVLLERIFDELIFTFYLVEFCIDAQSVAFNFHDSILLE